MLGYLAENCEPMAWVEEIIEPARAVDHPRLASLYAIASQCWVVGRIEEAVRYSDAGQNVIGSSRNEVPCGLEGWLFGIYMVIGQPKRTVELCRAACLARGRDTNALTRAALVLALSFAGFGDEAVAAANGVVDAAEGTHNPWTLSYALLAEGTAFSDANPTRALDALHRGMMIAQDSGNRANESHLAGVLGRLEAQHGDPLAALDHFTVAIRNYHDAGNTHNMRAALAALAAFLDRLGCYRPAATTAGFALDPRHPTAWIPELTTATAHLRDVLGDQTYESLARKGETMTTAAMATYAYDQIDQARAALNAVSEKTTFEGNTSCRYNRERRRSVECHAHAQMFDVGVRCLCHAAWVSPDQAVLPSGVVTFLFTDIEGSTRLWEADPEAMRVGVGGAR